MEKKYSTSEGKSEGELSVPKETTCDNGKSLPSDTGVSQVVKKDSEITVKKGKPTNKSDRLLLRLLFFLGIGGFAILGLLLWQWKAQIRSIQAFINSEIIYVRAPISGRLSLNTKLRLGQKLRAADVIGILTSEVENPRVSELRVREQELHSSFETYQQQLDGIKHQIADRTRLLQWFSQANRNQQKLQAGYSKAQVKQLQNELKSLYAEDKIAQANAKRYSALLTDGAIDAATAERRKTDAKQASAAVKAKQSQIEQAQFNDQAASLGLQLDNNRSLSYPEIQMIEIKTQIIDFQQQSANLIRQMKAIQAQLDEIRQELQVQNKVALRIPTDSVVWSIDTQSKEHVAANAPILQLLNCKDVWVEAFINEEDASLLSVGDAVEVRLVGENKALQGHIQTLRAGTGRVTVGQFVVAPPPEIERRQLPVRVVTARIQVDWTDNEFRAEEFCFAGRSVEVQTHRN